MNYAQARERLTQYYGQPSGLWDWSTKRDDMVRRSTPCETSCAHKSPEEAERHFYDYCLEKAQVHEHPDEQRKSVICGAWTIKELGNNQMWLAIRPVDLCEAHLTQEYLAQAQPFKSGMAIIHS